MMRDVVGLPHLERAGKVPGCAQAPMQNRKRRLAEPTFWSTHTGLLDMIARGRPLSVVLGALGRSLEKSTPTAACAVLLWRRHRRAGTTTSGDDELMFGHQYFICAWGRRLPVAFRRRLRVMRPEEFGHAVRGNQLPLAPEWSACRDALLLQGFRTELSIPVVSKCGDLLALIVICSAVQEPVSLAPETLESAQQIAAIAIQQHQIQQEGRKASKRLIQAQEAERRRVASALHNSVNQFLSAASLRLGSLEERGSADPGELKQGLQKVHELVLRAIEAIRELSEQLRPSELDLLGLEPALRNLCAQFQQAGVTVRFTIEALPAEMPEAVVSTVYRVAQEALWKIAAIATSAQLKLSLKWRPHSLWLAVEEVGAGSATLGNNDTEIVCVRQRAAVLGGGCSVQAGPAQRTRIAVEIPCA